MFRQLPNGCPAFPAAPLRPSNGCSARKTGVPSPSPPSSANHCISQQIVQSGLEEMSQTEGALSPHPFPLSPFLSSENEGRGGSSSYGGVFGDTEASMKGSAQKGQEEGMQQELVGKWPMKGNISNKGQLRSSERVPSNAPQVPSPERSVAFAPPAEQSQRPVISAETAADSNSNSLPVFLRGAPREQIEEAN